MDKKLIEELTDEIPNLMRYHIYNPNGSDYLCIFCNNYPRTNKDSIEHSEDCLGQRILDSYRGTHA